MSADPMSVSTVNLGSMLARSARRQRDKVALVSHEGRRLTYRELDILSNRFARGLQALGFEKADHIAVLSLNCIEQVVAFFGIFKMGGVVVPMNVRLAEAETAWILDHADAAGLVFSSEFGDRVDRLRGQLPGIRHCVAMDGGGTGGSLAFDEVLAQGRDEETGAPVEGDDTAMLMYTAGTTGRPKGVLMTHDAVLWNCVNWGYNGTIREDDRSLQVFPQYHVAALGSLLTLLYRGGSVYLRKAFDPKDCMETIQREGITRWVAAPTVFNMLLQLPGIETYDSRSLTMVGSGAAIMSTETQRRLREVFPSARFYDSYGMTEAAGGITTLRPEDFDRKTACVGTALSTVEVRVVDEDDRDAPVGEIIFRGNNMMKGYYKDAEATKEALRGGWMHTGDIGRFDEEGFLYIVDRKKDMIITGGENVYPREVEEVLYTHPLIAEAAVIGVPDPTWGETILAVVVLGAGKTAAEQEVIDYCRGKVAGFKCPKSVRFVDAIPKNPAGKILKKDLRELFAPGR